MKVFAQLKALILAMLVLTPVLQAAPLRIQLTGSIEPENPQTGNFDIVQDQARRVNVLCQESGGEGEQLLAWGIRATIQQVQIHGFKADTAYTCMARYGTTQLGGSNPVTLVTLPLPSDLIPPTVVVPAGNPVDIAYTLYNVGNVYYAGDIDEGFDRTLIRLSNNYLVVLDAEGNIRWYLRGPGAGDLDVSFIGDDQFLFGGMSLPSYAPTVVGLDKEVKFVATSEPDDDFITTGAYNHDAGLSRDGTSIFALAYAKHPEYDAEGFVVKQFSLENRLIWNWDSFSAIESGQLSDVSAIPALEGDPFHANTIWDRWEDGKQVLYVSMRNNSMIIKIDHSTKDIVWHMGFEGDFELLEADGTPADLSRWFFNQHDIKYDDGIMLVHDNGYDRSFLGGRSYTRVLRLQVDEAAMTVRILSEYTEDDWLEPFWGGYDVLENGHQLIAMGHCEFCEVPDSKRSALLELDAANKPVWRAEFSSDTVMVYRSERIGGCELFNSLTYCPTLVNQRE